jgi:hypothetical protein
MQLRLPSPSFPKLYATTFCLLYLFSPSLSGAKPCVCNDLIGLINCNLHTLFKCKTLVLISSAALAATAATAAAATATGLLRLKRGTQSHSVKHHLLRR